MARSNPLVSSLLVLMPFVAASATAYEMKEFSLQAGSDPSFITFGPDGNMWFTESGRDNLAILAASGAVTEIPLGGCGPVGITLAADGKMWFTCANPTGADKAVGKTSDGVVFTFHDVMAAGGPITATPGGVCYATAAGAATPNAAAFLLLSGQPAGPSIGSGSPITGLATGGDGVVWVTYATGGKWCVAGVGSLACNPGDPATTGPSGVAWSQRWGAASIADTVAGTIFFECDSYDNVQAGNVCSVPPISLSRLGATSHPAHLATGLDGTLWVTDPGTNEVDHIFIDALGSAVIERYPVPTPDATPFGIAVGPDGTVWFTEKTGQKIGRLRLRPPGDANGDGNVNVNDVFYLINFLFAGGAPPG